MKAFASGTNLVKETNDFDMLMSTQPTTSGSKEYSGTSLIKKKENVREKHTILKNVLVSGKKRTMGHFSVHN